MRMGSCNEEKVNSELVLGHDEMPYQVAVGEAAAAGGAEAGEAADMQETPHLQTKAFSTKFNKGGNLRISLALARTMQMLNLGACYLDANPQNTRKAPKENPDVP